MKNVWTVAELDHRKLFEVVPNRDPETSVRFSLPIPNWLDASKNPIYRHPNIGLYKGETRFIFRNYEDKVDQGVRINGEGVIIFTGPTPNQANKLRQIIAEYATDLSALKPEDVRNILDRAYKLGLMDRFNNNRSSITTDFDIVGEPASDPTYGSFVYKPAISACIYLSGSGEFLGATEEPQGFEKGAFVVFSGQSLESARKIIQAYDHDNKEKKLKIKIVSQGVFLKSRRTPDDSPVNLETLPVQDVQFRKYYKPKPITGFPEWLPEVRNIERQWLRAIEEVFERYGFANIETPVIEEVSVLTSKAESSDKRIYSVQPLHVDAENASEPKVALHYDLTVPMARYVAQHASELTFPFKRYQIQKVWRGDRPQKGRFREFFQCDIDVVDRNSLSLEFDAEFPMILHHLVKKLDIGNVIIGVSNRKIMQGFYHGLGIEEGQIAPILRVVDRIGTIGEEGVRAQLSEDLQLSEEVIDKCLALASIKETDASVTTKVLALGIDNPLLREGLTELDFVMDRLRPLPKGSVIADLSIVRGLDYYTGTVYEGKFIDDPTFPPILGGGRYDNLVSNFLKDSYPGVGISFGLTRVFAKLLAEKRLPTGKITPTQALVVLPNNGVRAIARGIVDELRSKGIAAELYHEPVPFAEQLKYADKKQIPYVVFPDSGPPHLLEVKDMRTGVQKRLSSIQSWAPGG